MKATSREIERILAALADSPRRIAETTGGMDDTRLRDSPDKKSWSVSDILVHLRSCADVWTHSIYAMLAEDEPVLLDINERKWAKVTRYSELPFTDSLRAYTMQREGLMHVLKDLSLESWEKSSKVLGCRHTVFTQARRLAKHEEEHCKQIVDLLNQI